MALGQIQLVVIAFPGNRFNGEIRNEIQKLVDQDIVNIVDAMFITKDGEGNVAIVELEEMTVVEIAAMLDIPPGTASSRLRRGREQFQQAVARIKATQAQRRSP